MTGLSSQTNQGGGPQGEPFIDDDLGGVPPDGADLEVEQPDDDSRLLRLAEEFKLLDEESNPLDGIVKDTSSLS